MTKEHLHMAGLVVLVIGVVTAFQRHVMPIPVVGDYLPK